MGDMIVISFVEGEVDVTLGDNFRYFTTDVPLTIVGATKATPGTWKSTHLGGSQTPVAIAAGSKISFDANTAAASTRVMVVIFALVGEKNA